MNTTTLKDVMSVTPEEIEASITRVHDNNSEMARVIEAMNDEAGFALCTVVAGAFTPLFDDFALRGALIKYQHAVFDIDAFVGWEIPAAIISDMIAHGADNNGARRLAVANGL